MKLGIYVSPRTVRKYWPPEPERPAKSLLSALEDVRSESRAVHRSVRLLGRCDRSIQILYVFLIMELGTRRIVHCHVTTHPTAEWTLQQFREAIPSDHSYRFLIRDRDLIFSAEVDEQLKAFGLRVFAHARASTASEGLCFTLHLLRTLR